MKKVWNEIRENTIKQGKLIHCITSPIAINDCANVVLALGAKPIMAEHPQEVAEITAIADALTVSYANITDARLESIMISGRTARQRGIPIVADMVGVTCSSMRNTAAKEFIKECRPTVIKGNVSEIKAVIGLNYTNTGIDVSKDDAISGDEHGRERLQIFARAVAEYASKTGSIVVATGEVDVITNGRRTVFVNNGSSRMSGITGTGCILNCVIGTYLAVTDTKSSEELFEGVVLSVVTLGLAGELACAENGYGSYHVSFLDRISTLSEEQLSQGARVEEIYN
ncbi:MAG: hydroxyethylthiazole kinase [Lachnospira sp.]